MRGDLCEGIVTIKIEEGNQRAVSLNQKSQFGKLSEDCLELSIIEACYLMESGRLDVRRVLECYQRYMEFVVDKAPTYKQFVQNMEEKMQDDEFLGDMELLLREDAGRFNPIEAYKQIRAAFIEQLPGKRE